MAESALSEKLKNPDFVATLLETFSDGVFVVDAEQRILFWNRAATGLTGFTEKEVLGSRMGEVADHVDGTGETLSGLLNPLRLVLDNGRSQNFQLHALHKAGYALPVNATIDPIFEGDKVLGAVEVFREAKYIDSLEKAHRRIQELSISDELTGVANRNHLFLLTEQEIRRESRTKEPLSAVLFDIAGFSRVNAEHGHETGDQLLLEMGRLLADNMRMTDCLGRLEADHFLFLLANCTANDAENVAKKLKEKAEKHSFTDKNLNVSIHFEVTQHESEETAKQFISRLEAEVKESKKV